jgi:predicted nucleic acid-binding protein
MRTRISSIDASVKLVADTSAIINLNATGCARTIISTSRNPIVVSDVVAGELAIGCKRDRRDLEELRALVREGLIEIVSLGPDDLQIFEKLVIGPAHLTLDDGEAATIAYAQARTGIAVIDERKATRMCREGFPGLKVLSTVDLLSRPEIEAELGRVAVGDAIYKALRDGRMSVPPHHVDWVVELVGRERANRCPSLPATARRAVPRGLDVLETRL